MNPIVATVLGIVGACFTLISVTITVVTFMLNRKKSLQQNTRESLEQYNNINQSLLKVNMKLDQVCNTTSDIQTSIRNMQQKQMEHTEKILKLENSINRAHERIDEIKKIMNGIEFPKGG